MKNLKFKVHSPEHSKAIQTRLLELGYRWFNQMPTFLHEQTSFIYARNTDEYFDHKYIECSNSPFSLKDFRKSKETLGTLDDLYDPEFIKDPVQEMTLEEVCKELGREIKIIEK